MSKLSKSLTPILLSALTLMIIVLGFAPNQGVSNMDSLHLSDFNGTATPNFLVNQRGSGVIAEFQDGGTPIATWNDGGSFVSGGAIDLNGQQLIMDADGDTSLTADTDDQIDIEVAGADDFVITANKFEVQTGSVIDLNGTIENIDADADTTMKATVDDVITFTIGAAGGSLDIATGNFKVGNGVPTFTQDGEDAYIEGELEAGGEVILGAQTTFVVESGVGITPTGTYQPMTAPALGATVNNVIAPTSATIGSQLILHNIDSTDAITIDGTGVDVECKANVVLAPQDTLTLLWNGTDWICLSNYDNS